MTQKQRRVVISGVGVISPLGNTKEAVWSALEAGRSGVGPLTSSPPGALPVCFAAEAHDFTGRIEDFGPLDREQAKAIRKGLKVMCRECQMGIAAAQRALADAGLTPGKTDPNRTGITFGSDYMISLPEEFTEGILQCINEQGEFVFSQWPGKGMPKMSPLWLLKYLPNMPASHLAIYNDFRGPNNSLTIREAAANAAIVEGFQTILRGSAEVMLVGATGTRTHAMQAVRAAQQEELANGEGDPAEKSRPFDLNRGGVVLGEGAGAIVLEELETAKARGATIYGEILGGASSAVAGRHLLARRDQAIANVLRATLTSSEITPDELGHVHAHGLATRSCDIEESRAINEVFGGRANPVPVVAAKSYFGNLGAGGGLVELICSLFSLTQQRLFRTLNYCTPDPECPLNVVHSEPVSAGGSFINVNVTPQGQASAVLVRRV